MKNRSGSESPGRSEISEIQRSSEISPGRRSTKRQSSGGSFQVPETQCPLQAWTAVHSFSSSTVWQEERKTQKGPYLWRVRQARKQEEQSRLLGQRVQECLEKAAKLLQQHAGLLMCTCCGETWRHVPFLNVYTGRSDKQSVYHSSISINMKEELL